MADFRSATTVDAPAERLFDYLSDVEHLPAYFSRMTSAHRGRGEEVETTAQLPDGREVQGTAWFRADPEAHWLEWGSEGPSGYGGRLEVSPSGEHSRVEVWLHTTRVPDGDEQVRDGIDETLANVKRLVEAERVA